MERKDGMNTGQAYTLYLCHALSTWQARSYEFAAIIFTAAAYPGGLRAASLIGISISVAAICFGPGLGRWIDHASSRLRTLVTTILVNRTAVIFACLIWLLIVPESSTSQDADDDGSSSLGSSILEGAAKSIAFSLLMCLGILESLSRKANVISIERDWVPALAPDTIVERYSLTRVNATMARIDILCKMLAPVVISWIFSVMTSVKMQIALVAATNFLSLGIEWTTATRLWSQSSALKQKEATPQDHHGTTQMEDNARHPTFKAIRYPSSAIWAYIDSLKLYFTSEVWAPSLAMCITQTSILSITGMTVVFLLNSGYSLKLVTAGEALSAFFELSSTFITPMAVERLAPFQKQNSTTGFRLLPQQNDDDGDHDEEVENVENANSSSDQVVAALSHIGTYSIVGMALILLPTVPILLYLTSTLSYPIPRTNSSPAFNSYPILTLLLFFCLAFSRAGRGTFALVTQQLAQARVLAHQRSAFAGTEQAFVSTFGLGHNLGTAIWSSPDEFGLLALGSFVAVAASATVYTVCWARTGRGHVRH